MFYINIAIINSTVTYTTLFAQREGVSRTLWVSIETVLNWHISNGYVEQKLYLFKFRNINTFDVKIAKNALRLVDTASVAHPHTLSDIVLPLPYKGNRLYIFRGEPYINYTLTHVFL